MRARGAMAAHSADIRAGVGSSPIERMRVSGLMVRHYLARVEFRVRFPADALLAWCSGQSHTPYKGAFEGSTPSASMAPVV